MYEYEGGRRAPEAVARELNDTNGAKIAEALSNPQLPSTRMALAWDNRLSLPGSWVWEPPGTGDPDYGDYFRWSVSAEFNHPAFAEQFADVYDGEPPILEISITADSETAEEAVEMACGKMLAFICEADNPLSKKEERSLMTDLSAQALVQYSLQSPVTRLDGFTPVPNACIDPAGRFVLLEYVSEIQQHAWGGTRRNPAHRSYTGVYSYGIHDRATGVVTAACTSSAAPPTAAPGNRTKKKQVIAASCLRMLKTLL